MFISQTSLGSKLHQQSTLENGEREGCRQARSGCCRGGAVSVFMLIPVTYGRNSTREPFWARDTSAGTQHLARSTGGLWEGWWWWWWWCLGVAKGDTDPFIPPRWVLHGAEEVRQGGDTTLNGPPMWFSRRQELSYAFSFATVSWRQILRGCCIHSAHFCLLSPPPTRLLPFSTCVAASVTKPLRDATDFLTNSAEMKPYPAEDCLHTAAGKRSVHSRTGLRVCPVWPSVCLRCWGLKITKVIVKKQKKTCVKIAANICSRHMSIIWTGGWI